MKSEYIHQLPEEWRQASAVFVALGDEQRQRILLMFEPGEELNISQIVAASTLSRTAVAHHLRVLRESGVLVSRKAGKEVWFHIDPERIATTLHSVLDYVQSNT